MNESNRQEFRNTSGRTTAYGAGRQLEPIPTLGASSTYAFAALGAGVGILIGVAIGATTWQHVNQARIAANQAPAAKSGASQTGAADDSGVVHADYSVPQFRDLQPVRSRLAGLRGHFRATWSDRLGYRLTIEPSDPAQQAAFAHMVSDPPRPLSVGILLKDGAGLVLCSQDVVLKYDPRKAVIAAFPQHGKVPNSSLPGGEALLQADLSRLQAQELDRESGKDVFENVVGDDGQIKAISSQGTMPCSKEDYASVATWSFTADFPSLDEQASSLKRFESNLAPARVSFPELGAAAKSPEVREVTNAMKVPAPMSMTKEARITPVAAPAVAAKLLPAPKAVAVAKAAPARAAVTAVVATAVAAPAVVAAAEAPAAFYIEGDDAVIDYDASVGVLETSMGKRFFLDKDSAVENVDAWADDRARVHYRCDESTATCTLTRGGAVILKVRLHG